MLSRASLLSFQRPLVAALARTSATSAPSAPANNDGLWQRPVRLAEMSPVRFGFIPDEWFTFFYKKTGVSGPFAFGAGVFTYLASKEIYVMEHEYYAGLSIIIMCIIFCKKVAPGIGKALNEEAQEIEDGWNAGRVAEIAANKSSIEHEKEEQWRTEGQLLLVDAKQENVQLQLEASYRERLATVYTEVKRRLDYQVQTQHVERRIKQKHLVSWVVGNVLKSITPDQEKENINKCLADLSALATKAN